MTQEISFLEIIKAREIIYRYLKPTSLIYYPLLSEGLGFEAYVKHENHNPTGSFKIRGGINLISSLSDGEKQRGVITATRGNHGQSIAMASKLFGVNCWVVVPYGNNPEKNAAIKSYGAELIEHGKDFDEAREKAEDIMEGKKLRYVHPANEPRLINGVGTYSLEIFEDFPDVDVIIYPIGAGSEVSGGLTVRNVVNPKTKIIGVQAEGAPAVYLSWKQGRMIETEQADTFAGGLATRVPFEIPFNIIKEHIDDIILVSDDEIKDGIRLLLKTTHNLAEGAGAAAIAAGRKIKNQLHGKKVAMILSGGNIDGPTLKEILSE